MTGLLLINLGTPNAPQTGAVRRYLRQFLSDPRVLDTGALARWLLLNLVILPFRPAKSAEAYRVIWDERGSPLLYHSRDLVAKVQARLGDGWHVALGMRYGNPSIADALAELRDRGIDRIVVLPLFPQYASSSTGSALEELYRAAGTLWNVPSLTVIDSFYDDEGFLNAFANVGRPVLQEARPDHVLFSFHGLPERQIHKSDTSGRHCLVRADCCERIIAANRYCYRAQCFYTARQLAAALDIASADYTVCFQSRLGRVPWIQPFTDVLIDELAAQGKKRLVVFSPAFVADCLETIEEIGVRAREQFLAAGGQELVLVPSLNATDAWAAAVANLALPHAQHQLPAASSSGSS